MQESYITIKENATAELTEKKSRFIASIFHIKNEEDANEKINEIKKLYRDVKHNVYAYRLEDGTEKYSEDGEPSGTAGVPILDILRGEKLINVLVVVTRYFGGILLGTGGLVRCYGGVTKLALKNATKTEMKLCVEFKIIVEYDNYNTLQYYCQNNDIKILNTQFLDKVELDVLVVDSYTDKFLHYLSEFTNGKTYCKQTAKYYHE